MRMTTKTPPLLTWHFCQIVVDFLLYCNWLCSKPIYGTLVVKWCLSFYHFHEFEIEKKLENAPSFQTLMEEDSSVALELICLASNIRKEVCGVLDNFLSFLKKFDERKSHILLVLMLDLRFKSLCLVFSFISRIQRVTIVEEYDIMSLYPMFMKCYYHLHPSIESNNGVTD